MALSISWAISSMDYTIENGIVQAIHYSASATDGPSFAESYGSIVLDPPGPSPLPYGSISEDTAKSWLFNKLSPAVVSSIEASLVAAINERKRPTKAEGLPWAG